jgi:hypothetical protein
MGEAWELFRDQMTPWLVAGAVVVLGNWLVLAALSALFGVHLPRGGGGFRPGMPPANRVIHAAVVAAVNGFFLGGMFRMACRQIRGKRVRAGDLFSVTDVLGELALGSAIYGGCCAFAFALLAGIPGLILAGVWMFTIPLIVDARMPAVQAMGQSWRVLKRQWLMATAFHTVAYLLAGVGFCLFCVGLLLTMPLYCLSIAVLYHDFFLAKPSTSYDKPASFDPDL